MAVDTVRIEWRRLWQPLQTSGDDAISSVRAVEQSANSGRAEDLVSFDCLIMLGPPGTGKSTELRFMYQTALESGVVASLIELRNVPTLDAFRRAVFSNSGPALERTLFIDGLDEVPASRQEVQSWIVSTFTELASKGELPRLRLTCRSADWPDQLRGDLAAIWSADNTAVFQLTALSKEDVELAVSLRLPKLADKFTAEITAKGMWPLAKSPVTLSMLENIFVAFDGALPSSLTETYRKGVLSLVEERRRSTSWSNDEKLTDLEKLKLLGRIATVSMLSGKQVVWGGLFSDLIPDDAIAVTDLAGGSETGPSGPVIADERAIREVVKTAIFQSDGPNRARWAHLSFAEFLAADYLAQKAGDPRELLSLLSSGEGDEAGIIPQLREVAAWLAGLYPAFRDLLVTLEPDLLLRSDVASGDDAFKESLAKGLLDRLARKEVLDIWRDSRRDFTRLCYEGLYQVLKPYIVDKRLPEDARSLAIFIARDCGQSEAGLDLLKIGLDPTDKIDVRATAIYTLSILQGPLELTDLKSLLKLGSEGDPKDELRGAVLSTLWPKYLSVTELFENLPAPNDDHTFGLYKSFLYKLKFDALSVEGALAALSWVGGLKGGDLILSHFAELLESVMIAAWTVAKHHAIVRKAFARLIVAHAKDHQGAISSVDLGKFKKAYFESTVEERGALVQEVTLASEDAGKSIVAALYGPWTLLVDGDLDWVLGKIQDSKGSEKEVLVRAALLLIGKRHPDEVEYVWDVAAKVPELAAALEQWFTTDINSPMAKWNRESHEKKKRASDEPKADVPPLSVELEKLLILIKQEPTAWWRINYLLLNYPGANASELNGNLKASAHWDGISESQKSAIIEGAYRFLQEYELPDLNFVGTNTTYRPASAGYRALRLLIDERGSEWALTPRIVGRWSPTVLWFHTNDQKEEFEIRKALAQVAFDENAELFYQVLSLIFERAAHVQDVIRLIEDYFDARMAEILASSLELDVLETHSRDRVTATLIEKRYPPTLKAAKSLAAQMLTPEAPSELSQSEIHHLAAWFTADPAEAWSHIWPIRLNRPEIANSIWLRIAGFDYRDWPVLSKLSAEQTGEAFIYLAAIYPGDDMVSGFVGPDDQLRMMLRSMLEKLAREASDAAIIALQKAQLALPDDERIAWYLKRASEAFRSSSWSPLAPREIIRKLGFDLDPRSLTASLVAATQAGSAQEAEEVAGASAVTFAQGALDVPEVTTTEPAVIVSRVAASLLNFLLIGTEWQSLHGGLSTLNRELCKELALRGHRVMCLVPSASNDDVQDARSHNVALLSLAPIFGYFGEETLDACLTIPSLPHVPDFVIGHDHKTGRAALRIQQAFLPGARYLHVIHTNPEESDQYKRYGFADGARMGGVKGSRQEQLCDASTAVIAVGPRLADHLKGRLESADKVFCLIPGMNKDYLKKVIPKPDDRAIEALFTGRTDDPQQKGLPVVMTVAGQLQSKVYGKTRTPKFVIRGIDFAKLKDGDWTTYGVDRATMIYREYTVDAAELAKDLRVASCVLMPSRTEAFGLAALDAISTVCPC